MKTIFLLILMTQIILGSNDFKTTQEACEDKNYDACFKTGFNYSMGYGVKTDLSKAIKYHDIACQHNHYEACRYIGVIYYLYDLKMQDLVKAKQYFTKACKGGDKASCEMKDMIQK